MTYLTKIFNMWYLHIVFITYKQTIKTFSNKAVICKSIITIQKHHHSTSTDNNHLITVHSYKAGFHK